MFENEVYEGIPELLRKLKENGVKLAVATSKPEKYAKIILEKLKIADYFELIAGSTFDESRIKKDQVIAYALSVLKTKNPDEVIMVGDRMFDILGGHMCKVRAIGVLYGYGSREELVSVGADYIAQRVEDIKAVILPEK